MPEPISVTNRPISDFVKGELDKALGKVPSGRAGAAEVTASLKGLEASAGWKLSARWDASVWYGRTWAGAQDGGARIRVTW